MLRVYYVDVPEDYVAATAEASVFELTVTTWRAVTCDVVPGAAAIAPSTRMGGVVADEIVT
jgi:hypothetical protein